MHLKRLVIVTFCAFAVFVSSLHLQLAYAAEEGEGLAKASIVTPPVAYNLRIIGSGKSVRILVDFDREITAKPLYMSGPNRVVIELPDVVFSLQSNVIEQVRGLITDLRYGAVTKNKSRMVFTLASPAKLDNLKIEKVGNSEKTQLIADLSIIENSTYEELLQEQADLMGTSGSFATKGDRVREPQRKQGHFKVVIDPGHGGIDAGAVGVSGTFEKQITLSIGQQLKKAIESAGPFDVSMTRSEDVFVSLKERVNFTRRVKADLFISIHADSLEQSLVRGATIYTLSKKASDRLSAKLADAENRVDLVAGLALPENEGIVTDILADLTARETIHFSRQFSAVVVSALRGKTTLIKNPQRFAAFGVLKAPEVPSVLLELGYLSNRRDEKLLKSPKWQKSISDNLAKAVAEFFRPRI